MSCPSIAVGESGEPKPPTGWLARRRDEADVAGVIRLSLAAQFGEFDFENQPNRTARYVATARAALAERGVEDPTDHIMVATTVIEVGVNVPNASVMVIENTERFGLSQLHQLRGRVGRGADQSYCILMTDFKISKEGRERIATMVRTTNGFEIAEADLRLRGPGDIQGTQQSGLLDFKLLDIGTDTAIMDAARNIAARITENDPNLDKDLHLFIRTHVAKLRHKQKDWGRIS